MNLERTIALDRPLSIEEAVRLDARIDAAAQATLSAVPCGSVWELVEPRTIRIVFAPVYPVSDQDLDAVAVAFARELSALLADAPLATVPQRGRRSNAQRLLGLPKNLADAPDFKPYRKNARRLAEAVSAEYARNCGGELGPAAAAMVQNACLETAASRYLFDRTAGLMPVGAEPTQEELAAQAKLFQTAASLALASKQNLTGAWALACQSNEKRSIADFERCAKLAADASDASAEAEKRAQERRAREGARR